MGNKEKMSLAELAESFVKRGIPLTNEMIQELFQGPIHDLIHEMVPAYILEQALKMDYHIDQKVSELIFHTEKEATNREKVTSKIAGVVGTCWANQYFRNQGYTVENEVPVFDDDGHTTTKSDLVLTAPDGKKTCIELKTIKALISDEKDYPSKEPVLGERISRENIVDIDKTPLQEVAVQTGKKAIQQVMRTRANLDKFPGGKDVATKLCVYQGTIISPDIEAEVRKYADIEVLPLEVDQIFEYSMMLVDALLYKGRKMIHPSRGETDRKIDIPDIGL